MVLEFLVLQRYAIDDLTYDTIVNSRKQLLKGHVDRTFDDIELLRDDLTDQYNVYVTMFGDEIHTSLAGVESEILSWNAYEDLIETIIRGHQSSKEPIFDQLEALVYDLSNESIVYCTQLNKEIDLFHEVYDKSSVKDERKVNELMLYVYFPENELDEIVKLRITNWIRDLRIEGSDYLWINEVIRYEGGHDYGIRLVHPNLPETEGILLSTETEDIKGNKPYQTELDGINAEGEVYFRYYFKEFNSEKISEKMTYAKLYEPYNWIISTGIYMSDIEELRVASDIRQRNLMFTWFILTISFVVLFGLMYLAIRMVMHNNSSLKKEKDEFQVSNQTINEELGKVQSLANKDSLTGLLNRRGIFERMEEEFSRFMRQDFQMIIIMADIDYFKSVNDNYGHEVGDEVLLHMTAVLQKSIRREDIVGRLGGDEFLLILPYANLEDGMKVSEGIQKELAQSPFVHRDVTIHVSVSIGITEALEDDDLKSALKRTDIAMYQSKRSGRDKITVFE